MYALRNMLDKHPIQLAGAIMGWVNLAIIADWVTMKPAAVAGLNGALVLTLGLFVATKTANVSVLNALSDSPPTMGGVELSSTAKPKQPTRKQSGQGRP